MESFASSNGSVGNLTLALLRDPSAVVELFSAFLLAFYMLQIVLKNSSPLSQDISAGLDRDFFNDDEDCDEQLGRRPISFSSLSFKKAGRSPSAASSSGALYSQQRNLPTRERLQHFNRAVFSELSDRGAIFPKKGCSISREQRLKLYMVGTYVSSKKQSLRKSSALRIRLPQ